MDLIETLWNVKSDKTNKEYIFVQDLIETLWNVKKNINISGKMETKGFNRDIVECKEGRRRKNNNSRCDLIETLWNVKAGRSRTGRQLMTGFNRDIVECKEEPDISFLVPDRRFNRDIVECKGVGQYGV